MTAEKTAPETGQMSHREPAENTIGRKINHFLIKYTCLITPDIREFFVEKSEQLRGARNGKLSCDLVAVKKVAKTGLLTSNKRCDF